MIEKIDQNILEKFKKKKAMVEEQEKNLEKINKDKRKMESRRK